MKIYYHFSFFSYHFNTIIPRPDVRILSPQTRFAKFKKLNLSSVLVSSLRHVKREGGSKMEEKRTLYPNTSFVFNNTC